MRTKRPANEAVFNSMNSMAKTIRSALLRYGSGGLAFAAIVAAAFAVRSSNLQCSLSRSRSHLKLVPEKLRREIENPSTWIDEKESGNSAIGFKKSSFVHRWPEAPAESCS